jgi:hypothetical protein
VVQGILSLKMMNVVVAALGEHTHQLLLARYARRGQRDKPKKNCKTCACHFKLQTSLSGKNKPFFGEIGISHTIIELR